MSRAAGSTERASEETSGFAGAERHCPLADAAVSNSSSTRGCRSVPTSPIRTNATSTPPPSMGQSNHSRHCASRNPPATPSKLRRKVSVEHDSVDNAVSAQRLVEYFLVISCHPRWENAGAHPSSSHPPPAAAAAAASNPPAATKGFSTPQPNRPSVVRQRAASSPIVATRLEREGGHPLSSAPTASTGLAAPQKTVGTPSKKGTWVGRSNSDARRKRDKAVGDHATATAAATTDIQSSPELNDESRDESGGSAAMTTIMRPPQPRETWKREEQQEEGHAENIHVPLATAGDSHTFAPKVTARFPMEDYSDHPWNPMVTQFCFPAGEIILPSLEYQMPIVHHFVLTNDRGKKVYGTCLTVYEEYHPGENTPWGNPEKLHLATVGEAGIEVSVNSENPTLYVPRCLCILSIWPYMTAFREYLAQLYRLATSTNCMKAPIERYIMNICMEIPAPPPGAFEVQMTILDSVIRFWSPPAKLPVAYVALPYQILFDCLDIENIMHLWYCLTMERKVLLLSSQHSILTVCSEILCSLLYPMKWSHLYVPLLPKFLCPILDAPVPYLCGVTRENWTNVHQFVSDETIVVDLDRNSVMFGPNTQELPAPPGKKWSKLQSNLKEIAGGLFWRARGLETEYQQFQQKKMNQQSFNKIAKETGEQRWMEKLQTLDQAFNLQYTPDSDHLTSETANENEQNQWDRLQESFLRFFVSIFKDYRKFVHVPDKTKLGSPTLGSTDWSVWSKNHSFDRDGFISAQKSENVSYLSELCATQQFDDFITKRLYSPELPDIIFFDQSIDAKLNRSRLKLKKLDTPFLQSAKTHKQLQKFFAVEPNTTNLPEEPPFIYKTWPENLDSRLFCHPRPIPRMITAEFDRQASLVKQLRTNHSPRADEYTDLIDYYGSDYDTSPEGMAFTVFFFTYSSIIGREWEQYQQKRREPQVEPPVTSLDRDGGDQERIPEDFNETDNVEENGICSREEICSREIFSDFTLGVFDGNSCRDAGAAVEDAVACVTAHSPCPNFNSQAQAAYESLTSLALSLDLSHKICNKSLVDDDQAFAEYQEAKEVASAQLDLAFDALKIMETRGILTDPDVFQSLMGACGRCGDTKRALELIQTMKRDGLVADNDVLVYFVASFAHYSDEGESVLVEGDVSKGRRGSDAYSHFLKKKFLSMKGSSRRAKSLQVGGLTEDDSSASDFFSDSGSEVSSFSTKGGPESAAPSFLNLFSSSFPVESQKANKKKRRRKRRMSLSVTKDVISDRVKKQLILGEALLEFLYPDIHIDAFGDACPQCSHIMKEEDIVAGWRPCAFQDFTTRCPQCHHRFVPRFKISTSFPAFEGSQGPGTPLYCEFLSPWVLRKELGHIIVSGGTGISEILDPDWRSGRDIKATIWWNLVAMFKRHRLPFTFLLQGSFQNRLINPMPQD